MSGAVALARPAERRAMAPVCRSLMNTSMVPPESPGTRSSASLWNTT